MEPLRFEGLLIEFVEAAAARLHADVNAGNEVPFELEAASARRSGTGPALYCYRPRTAEYIAERQPELERLPSHAELAKALAAYEGLDRYLAAAGVETGRAARPSRARTAIRTILAEVFAEQSDFELRPERLRATIARVEQAASASASGVSVLAVLHGLTVASPEVPLTAGLEIAHPEALQDLPEAVRAAAEDGAPPLVAMLRSEDDDPERAVAHGRAVLIDLLRALRLFGDGRVTLGALGFYRVGGGTWTPFALGTGGRPHGMLVVTAEQEDELRAFCNLVSRRAPTENELAWALRRFELGCDREDPYEALSDHLLALRALLEPEGPASGMLAGRLAALCATPERRLALTQRAVQALALEREVIEGTMREHAAAAAISREIADHLRALLRDVICGHLDPDLSTLADEILLEVEAEEDEDPVAPQPEFEFAPGPSSAEEVFGYAGEAQEILDLSI